jgi:hypothetical protein
MPIYDQKQSGDDQHNQNKEPDKTPGGNEDSEPYNRKSSKHGQIDKQLTPLVPCHLSS